MSDLVDIDKLLSTIPRLLAAFHKAQAGATSYTDLANVRLQTYVSPPLIEAMLKEILDLRLKLAEGLGVVWIVYQDYYDAENETHSKVVAVCATQEDASKWLIDKAKEETGSAFSCGVELRDDTLLSFVETSVVRTWRDYYAQSYPVTRKG